MARRDYQNVQAMLVEGNSMLRSDLRAAMVDKGIRNPIVCRNLDAFLEVARQELLDLVVCDSRALGSHFSEAMQRIRHNAVGGNPFVVVIATVHDGTMHDVQDALNGGVDDLVVKPTPVKRIVERIENLVLDRRPFIVSNGYVGPTRRNATRPSNDDGTVLNVPNTLHSKVVDKETEDNLRQMIDQAVADLEEKIVQHPLSGIDRLIRRAMAYGDGKGGNDGELRRDFTHLMTLSLEMSRRYRGSTFNHIADLAMALANLAKRIADQNPATLRRIDLNLLSHLSEVIRRSIAAEERSAAVVHEIAVTVDRFSNPAAATDNRSRMRH